MAGKFKRRNLKQPINQLVSIQKENLAVFFRIQRPGIYPFYALSAPALSGRESDRLPSVHPGRHLLCGAKRQHCLTTNDRCRQDGSSRPAQTRAGFGYRRIGFCREPTRGNSRHPRSLYLTGVNAAGFSDAGKNHVQGNPENGACGSAANLSTNGWQPKRSITRLPPD